MLNITSVVSQVLVLEVSRALLDHRAHKDHRVHQAVTVDQFLTVETSLGRPFARKFRSI